MHLVGFSLEPGEEAAHAVPDALGPFAFALYDPLAALGAELPPGSVERNAALLREFLEVLLTLGVRFRLPGLYRAPAQRLALIRNDEAVIDPDGAAEAAAGLAGAYRGVEGEQARVRLLVGAIALGAVQFAGIAP